jgi:ABC-type transporter Mla subunit MlaD
MARQSKKKNLRDQLEELASQAGELSQQVVERAPVVRDQLVDRLPDRDQLVDRLPDKAQLVDLLPDKAQLLDLRDDLLDRLPDTVTDKLPEKVKPKRSRLKRIAVIGVLTGAVAAAVAVLRGRAQTPPSPEPFPPPTPAAPPTGVVPPTGVADQPGPATQAPTSTS